VFPDVSEDYKKQLDDQRQQFKQDLQEMADDMAQRMETMEANVKANVKEGIDQVEGAMEEKVAAEINSVRQDVQALGRQIDSTCDKFLLAVDRIPSTEGAFVPLVRPDLSR
jgi:DNA anti-recombination protein RmuC